MTKPPHFEQAVLDSINKIQHHLNSLDKKIDILINRPPAEVKPLLKTALPQPQVNIPSNDRHKGRPMFTATCADCQKECTIPFKPSGDRPVYCKDCFSRRKVISLSKVGMENNPKQAAAVEAPIIKPIDTTKIPAKKKKPQAVKKTLTKKKIIKKKK